MLESNSNPIDEILDIIKPSLLPAFVTKWSDHKHLNSNPLCNFTLTMDGDWKLGRAKCLHGDLYYNSEEFGSIKIGCKNTPDRQSYFCKDHRQYETKFQVHDDVIVVNPSLIKLQKLSKTNFFNLKSYLFLYRN